ncbi:Membrane-associated phospholipid phosphatase [hydrothermal vent metagenome]|uniref:Membrane-associated phospholipid phosphatase n=1 Tax=hydrothermal vent metagenome TaxID=652676 RepID=A0A3B1ARC1_9ZZZZ
MTKIIIALIFLLLFTHDKPACASKNIEQAGDVLQVVIPSVAFVSTLYLGDKQGQIQFLKSFTSNFLITNALKSIVTKKRPNGGLRSFPSGHTSAAFQGAAFIHKRYGFFISVPAYLAAGFVGYSRVESKFHFNNDVFAGAAIGILNSFYFTTHFKNFNLRPTVQTGVFALQFSIPI